jgi:hypothetical protein
MKAQYPEYLTFFRRSGTPGYGRHSRGGLAGWYACGLAGAIKRHANFAVIWKREVIEIKGI